MWLLLTVTWFLLIPRNEAATLKLYCDIFDFGTEQYDTVIGREIYCGPGSPQDFKNDNFINSVSGTKQELSSVKMFFTPFNYIRSQDFPKNLQTFFTHLEGIYYNGNHLMFLKKEDIEVFTELRSLHLPNNLIETLESDLFSRNPNLEDINFRNNKIKIVGAEIFWSLEKLRKVDLRGNTCIDKKINRRSELSSLERALDEGKCLKLKPYENIKGSGKYAVSIEIDGLTRQISDLSEKLQISEELNEKLKRKIISWSCNNKNGGECSANLEVLNSNYETCNVERKHLLKYKSDSEVVKLICEEQKSKEPYLCNVSDLKVFSSEASVKKVAGRNYTIVNLDDIRKLQINADPALYIPLNISEHFKNLKELSVVSSGLMVINGDAFKNMDGLLTLTLSSNMISKVTSTDLRYLKSLKILDLSFNRIISINAKAFDNLINLEELLLNDNELMKLKSALFAQFINLRILSLNNNKLQTIEHNIFDSMTNLQSVDLHNNSCIDMKFPTESLENIKSSINENCDSPVDFCCEFEALSSNADDLTCQAVDLIIDSPRKTFSSLNAKADCTTNELKDNSKEVNEVKTLKIIDQRTIFFADGIADYFPNLVKLKISNSSLQTIERKQFKGLKTLTVLDLSFNDLTSLTDDLFEEIQQLKHIDMSHNQIKSIPSKIFQKLVKLEYLNMRNNLLIKLEADLLLNKEMLKEIHFNDNKLADISVKIFRNLTSLKVANFKRNECIDAEFPSDLDFYRFVGRIGIKC